jgi:hypothetical protein
MVQVAPEIITVRVVQVERMALRLVANVVVVVEDVKMIQIALDTPAA